MCIVSNVGDYYCKKDIWPLWSPAAPFPSKESTTYSELNHVSRYEFNLLKRQVEDMKRELEAGKKQDIAEGNPDCEMEDKVVILKKIAEMFDIDLTTVFPN